MEFLINDHHLKVNERDENKKEPLYDAIRAQNPEMIKTLIRLGARTTSKYEGRNYLTIAILMKSIEVAKVLLESGLSYTDKDYNGKSAFDYAQKYGLKDLVELIKKEKA